MIRLATDALAFAEAQSKAQRREEQTLFRSARLALGRFDEDDWYHGLVEAAIRLMRARFRVETGSKDSRLASSDVKAFRKAVETSLKKTTEPTEDTIDQQARSIAVSLSTSAFNAAVEAAAEHDEDPDSLVKVWFSMEDDRVRPTHAAANGQTVDIGEQFTVGGSKMDRPGDMSAPIEEWINCRCLMGLVRRQDAVAAAITTDGLAVLTDENPTGGAMDDDTQVDEEFPAPPPEDRLDYTDDPIPFWGCLAPEGEWSGDGRRFRTDGLRSRPLPLPLASQKFNEPGHDGSFKVGNIERSWRHTDGLVYGMGHFLTVVPEVDEVIGIMAESGGRMGVSVDADDGAMEMVLRDGRTLEEALDQMEEDGEGIDMDDILTEFITARICGATLCNIPAFHQAFIALGEVPEEFAPTEGSDLLIESRDEQEAAAAVTAAGPVKTEDGPGWLTHPVDTDRLRDYWVRGKGAAKIGWGVPGDFNRCRVNLAKYVKPQFLSGYCANRHYDALGFWPGNHHSADVIAASAGYAEALADGGEMAPALRFVFTDDRPKPPMSWFEDPQLVGPSPITVTEEGRIYGHLAKWGECHIGISGVCTEPPHSTSNYAYFRTGYVLTDEGEVPTGTLTLGTGHADLRSNANQTLAHYDDTGTGVAYVAAGEDDIGIWVAGCVAPGTTDDEIVTMRASALSGDWRMIGGELELVAALHVNVQGFPIPHTGLAASGGRQTALVAAGIVPPVVVRDGTKAYTLEEIVSAVFAEQEKRQAAERLHALSVATGRDPASRMKAVATMREG